MTQKSTSYFENACLIFFIILVNDKNYVKLFRIDIFFENKLIKYKSGRPTMKERRSHSRPENLKGIFKFCVNIDTCLKGKAFKPLLHFQTGFSEAMFNAFNK